MSRFHQARRITKRRRREVLDRDRWRCTTCGKAGRLEMHHIKPMHQGGDHEDHNLLTLCRGCHLNLHRPPAADNEKWAAMVEELQDVKFPVGFVC